MEDIIVNGDAGGLVFFVIVVALAAVAFFKRKEIGAWVTKMKERLFK